MTRNAAKKHREIITAFMNGAEIQASWGDGEWHDEDRPPFCASMQYRIKPTPPKPEYRPYLDLSEVDRIGEIAEYRNGGTHAIGAVSVERVSKTDVRWFTVGRCPILPKEAVQYAIYRSDGAPCGVKVEE